MHGRLRKLLTGRHARSAFCACLLFAHTAHGCGIHHGTASGLDAYPGSLQVAVAIAQARSDNLLSFERTPTLDFAGRPQSMEFWRIMSRMRSFAEAVRGQVALEGGSDEPGRDFSLMLVRTDFWSNFDVEGSKLVSQLHSRGPEPLDTVVLTDDSVISAVLDDRLSIEQAFDRKLIVVNGPEQRRVETMLLAALR